jgi:hypothetical protein
MIDYNLHFYSLLFLVWYDALKSFLFIYLFMDVCFFLQYLFSLFFKIHIVANLL